MKELFFRYWLWLVYCSFVTVWQEFRRQGHSWNVVSCWSECTEEGNQVSRRVCGLTAMQWSSNWSVKKLTVDFKFANNINWYAGMQNAILIFLAITFLHTMIHFGKWKIKFELVFISIMNERKFCYLLYSRNEAYPWLHTSYMIYAHDRPVDFYLCLC